MHASSLGAKPQQGGFVQEVGCAARQRFSKPCARRHDAAAHDEGSRGTPCALSLIRRELIGAILLQAWRQNQGALTVVRKLRLGTRARLPQSRPSSCSWVAPRSQSPAAGAARSGKLWAGACRATQLQWLCGGSPCYIVLQQGINTHLSRAASPYICLAQQWARASLAPRLEMPAVEHVASTASCRAAFQLASQAAFQLASQADFQLASRASAQLPWLSSR